jgi:hypothetical protein
MPIRMTEDSTGIYREIGKEIRLQVDATPLEIRRMRKALAQQVSQLAADWDIHRHLNGLEEAAKRIIKAHGGFPGLRKRKTSKWFPLPDEAPPTAKRAVGLFWYMRGMQDTLKTFERQNPNLATRMQDVAYEAYRLGRWAEATRVSPFEPFVKTGVKRREILAKARDTLKEERAAEYPKWQAKANELLAENPRLSWTAICEKARRYFPTGRPDVVEGKESVVSLRAFQMHTKDPRK